MAVCEIPSPFPHLRHIGWNLEHKCVKLENPTTYVLHFFEIRFPNKEEWETNYAYLDIEEFDDGYTVPQCFGAYCPTLETIAFIR